MPTHTFTLNGEKVTVDVEDDVRLLWVIRDMLGITGPKYGCGINVCKACTCHINGKAINP
jgi:isoquinoline 1-oxidoreductase alpha subunit